MPPLERRRIPTIGKVQHDFRLARNRVKFEKPWFVSECGEAATFGGPRRLYSLPQDGPHCPRCATKAKEPFRP